jgi:hypothetical protein
MNVQNRPRLQVGVSAWLWFSVGVVWCIPIFSLQFFDHITMLVKVKYKLCAVDFMFQSTGVSNAHYSLEQGMMLKITTAK